MSTCNEAPEIPSRNWWLADGVVGDGGQGIVEYGRRDGGQGVAGDGRRSPREGLGI